MVGGGSDRFSVKLGNVTNHIFNAKLKNVNIKTDSHSYYSILRLFEPSLPIVAAVHLHCGCAGNEQYPARTCGIFHNYPAKSRGIFQIIRRDRAEYFTIILRNRSEYRLILSRRGRRLSWPESWAIP